MEKRERIGKSKNFLMLIVAIIIDIAGAILNFLVVGGAAASIVGDIIFFIWYWSSGIPIWNNPKMLRRAGTSAVIELIPVVDILPAFTYFVWKTNKQIMQEDMVYNNAIENEKMESRYREQMMAKSAEEDRRRVIIEQNNVENETNAINDEEGYKDVAA